MKKFNQKSGFTVIELILGLAIFAIISATVFGAFSAGMNLSRRSQTQNIMYREMVWAFDLMAKELENMIPYDFSSSGEKTAFLGTRSQIGFILSDGSQMMFVSYYLVPEDQVMIGGTFLGKRSERNEDLEITPPTNEARAYLMRSEQPFIDYVSGGAGSNTEEEIIATHVRLNGLKFSFGYGDLKESEKIEWRDSWGKTYIPSHVKMEIEFLSPDNTEDLNVSREVLVFTGFLGKDET